ncbi:MAG TPA: hypothetical protein PLZ12_20360 [Saprospiraceae bacterium]|nr:hypothetical protein [Saprospiraceae bacterium]
MRYAILLLAAVITMTACRQNSPDTTTVVAPPTPQNTIEQPASAASADLGSAEDTPNLPVLELSYFQPNKDGSGIAGVPRPDKVEKPPKGKLISYKYFKAHIIPRADGPGEDINVYQPEGGLAYIGGGEAAYYAGIYNQYLLLDVGTSASKRQIMAINMVSGDTTYRADYHGDYVAMYGQYLVHLSADPNASDCQVKGKNLPGKMHRAYWVNLVSAKPKASAQQECLYVE